jgi:hypothetical protein
MDDLRMVEDWQINAIAGIANAHEQAAAHQRSARSANDAEPSPTAPTKPECCPQDTGKAFTDGERI